MHKECIGFQGPRLGFNDVKIGKKNTCLIGMKFIQIKNIGKEKSIIS